nr:hypothetical protein [Vibrio nigripulchritudo]
MGREFTLCFQMVYENWYRGTFEVSKTPLTDKIRLNNETNVDLAVAVAGGNGGWINIPRDGMQDILLAEGVPSYIDIDMRQVAGVRGKVLVQGVSQNGAIYSSTDIHVNESTVEQGESCQLTVKNEGGKIRFDGDDLTSPHSRDLGVLGYQADSPMKLSFKTRNIKRSNKVVVKKRHVQIYYRTQMDSGAPYKILKRRDAVPVSGQGEIQFFPYVNMDISELNAGTYKTRIEVTCAEE